MFIEPVCVYYVYIGMSKHRRVYVYMYIYMGLVSACFISRRVSQTRHELRKVRGRPEEKKVVGWKIVERLTSLCVDGFLS